MSEERRRSDRESMTREQIVSALRKIRSQRDDLKKWKIGAIITSGVASAYTAFVAVLRFTGAPDRTVDLFEYPEFANPVIAAIGGLLTAFYFAGPWWWAAAGLMVVAALSGAIYTLYVKGWGG